MELCSRWYNPYLGRWMVTPVKYCNGFWCLNIECPRCI